MENKCALNIKLFFLCQAIIIYGCVKSLTTCHNLAGHSLPQITIMSRVRGSIIFQNYWIPAVAGMTGWVTFYETINSYV